MTDPTASPPNTRPYSNFAAAEQRVNFRSRQSMIAYLVAHNRHDEGNGFGGARWRYASNVKLDALSIPASEREAAGEALNMQIESGDDTDYTALFEDFASRHNGAQVGFSGRGGGWIVLFSTDADPEPISSFSTPALKSLCRLVLDFDQMCDDAVELFHDLVVNFLTRPAPKYAPGDRLMLPATTEFQGLALSDDLAVTVTKREYVGIDDTLYHLEYVGADGARVYRVTAFEDELESARKQEARQE